MIKEYDIITAKHYRAFRPPLHEIILNQSIAKKEKYARGLDIGCGTGHSSMALAYFCNTVDGIDPSADMLSKGILHSNISYSLFDKNYIDFEDSAFNIITLAGSLWYAKSQNLLNEIVRVGSKNAIVLVYDFEVLLKEILTAIGFETNSDNSNPYNHPEDFSGLTLERIEFIEKRSEKVQLLITSNNLAHLILAVKEQYIFLAKAYGSNDLYDKIVAKLNTISNMKPFDIGANTFFTSYRIY